MKNLFNFIYKNNPKLSNTKPGPNLQLVVDPLQDTYVDKEN